MAPSRITLEPGTRSRVGRRSTLLAGAIAAATVSAILLAGTASPADAAAAQARTAPSFRSTTSSLPNTQNLLVGRAPGKSAATTLTPMAAPAEASDLLSVTTDPASIADYWYWASGVTVTVHGVYAGQSVRIEDVAPSGKVETFDPVQSDSNGDAVVTVKSTTYLPEIGQHTLIATADNGATGRATLAVTGHQARPLTSAVTPATIDRHAWPTTPVTVTAKGFSPHERVSLHAFQPDGFGQIVGANAGLRADANGVFRYQLQAASVAAQFGTWEVAVLDSTNNLAGSTTTTFTVTEGTPAVTVGTTTITPKTLTPAALSSTGVGYTLTGLKPWDVTVVTLTTPRGIEYPIGKFRASSTGRLVGGILSQGQTDAGTYRVHATSILTANTTNNTFTVTPDSDHPLVRPTASAPKTITQLTLIDPANGLRFTASGLDAGMPTQVRLISRTQDVVPWSTGSIATRTTGAAGTATFQLASKTTVPAGTYTLEITQNNGNPILLRQPITVTK